MVPIGVHCIEIEIGQWQSQDLITELFIAEDPIIQKNIHIKLYKIWN
jgi:hypothetical protein